MNRRNVKRKPLVLRGAAAALILLCWAAAGSPAAADREAGLDAVVPPGATETAGTAGRDAYADLLREKLLFTASLAKDMAAAGWNEPDAGDPQALNRECAELLWDMRGNAEVQNRLREILLQRDISAQERLDSIRRMAAAVAALYSGHARVLSDPRPPVTTEAGPDAGFANLLRADQLKKERTAFLLNLAQLFGTDAAGLQDQLPLEQEEVGFLWEREPDAQALRNVRKAVLAAQARGSRVDRAVLEAVLADPEAFFAKQEIRPEVNPDAEPDTGPDAGQQPGSQNESAPAGYAAPEAKPEVSPEGSTD